MPPIHTHETVIDLSSSPSSPIPTPVNVPIPPRPRVQTRAKPPSQTFGGKERARSHTPSTNSTEVGTSRNGQGRKDRDNARVKGKQRALKTLGSVIELTDSEDEGPTGRDPRPIGDPHKPSSSPMVGAASGASSSSALPDVHHTINVNPEKTVGLPTGLHNDVGKDATPVAPVDNGKGKAKEQPNKYGSSTDRSGGPENQKDGGDDKLEIPRAEPNFGPRDNGEPMVGPAKQPAVEMEAGVAVEPDPVAAIDVVPDQDPASQTLIGILEVTPDVDPEFLHPLIERYLANFSNDPVRTAEYLLEVIFERGSVVPRIKSNAKGKGKRPSEAVVDKAEAENDRKKAKIDWASVDRPFRGGPKYVELALTHLQTSFPYIPKRYLRAQLLAHNSHYAPTHLAIQAAERAFVTASKAGQNPDRGYGMKVTKYNPAKDVFKAQHAGWKDEVLEEERKWIVERDGQEEENRANSEGDGAVNANDKGKGKSKAIDTGPEEEPDVADGEGIECQCCFAEYFFENMVQCPEAHLFCKTCISQYASTQLGSHSASLLCMHPSDCKQPFPESELRRVLDTKLMELYERVKQQKEIEDAELEGLEECPFCEWKCVIEASREEEKLFRCGNEEGGCGVVSCRMCKKEDHLPKSCKEVTDDKHLNSQHAVEEAMTQALMRQCPKCKKPFIKESGCNKMTCPNCRTLSCYICREIINGYDHFQQNQPGQPGGSKRSQKCLLWDSVDHRHADEVKAAAERALAAFKGANPDAEIDAIKIDIPKALPPPPLPVAAVPVPYNGAHNMMNNNAFNIAAMNAHQARIQHEALMQQQQALQAANYPAYQQPLPHAFQQAVQMPQPPAPRPAPVRARQAAARRRSRRVANAQAPQAAHNRNNAPAPAPVPPAPVRHAVPPPPQPGKPVKTRGAAAAAGNPTRNVNEYHRLPGMQDMLLQEEQNERERRERQLLADALRRHQAERPRALNLGMPGMGPGYNAPAVGVMVHQDLGRHRHQARK